MATLLRSPRCQAMTHAPREVHDGWAEANRVLMATFRPYKGDMGGSFAVECREGTSKLVRTMLRPHPVHKPWSEAERREERNLPPLESVPVILHKASSVAAVGVPTPVEPGTHTSTGSKLD